MASGSMSSADVLPRLLPSCPDIIFLMGVVCCSMRPSMPRAAAGAEEGAISIRDGLAQDEGPCGSLNM